MKVKLLRTAKIVHHPGEIVEVSPDEARFLLGIGSAIQVQVVQPETPEQLKTPETPEGTKQKKTTRSKT